VKSSTVLLLVGMMLLAAACAGETPATTELPNTAGPATTAVPTSTVTSGVATTTSAVATTTSGGANGGSGTATASFSVPVGENGVTYDLSGGLPGGPSSFAVLDDGSVVIADTMALRSGRPRLLRFDAVGDPLSPIVLTEQEVASIVDVASDGERLAVLDVYVAQGRYRVLVLNASGAVEKIYDVPQGFHLEDGLTGLVWDDSAVLLEIEWGARYGKVAADGAFEPTRAAVFDGVPITISPGNGLTTVVEAGPVSFDVVRTTELGGASLIGRAPDGSIVLALDEVGLDDEGAIEVIRTVQRYSPAGKLVAETTVGLQQFVDISRTLELTADGRVAHLVTLADRVEIRILDV
jgi:hypothetical protein